MGNSSLAGEAFVQLQQYDAFQGQQVQGTVHIHLNQTIPPSSIYLIFKGKQYTHWVQTSHRTVRSNGKLRRVISHIPHTGTHHIVNFKIPLYNSQGQLSPGGFTIPFYFTLPSKLPGSFFYTSGSTQASIQYKFKAKLQTIQKQKIKNNTDIWIKQNVEYDLVETDIVLQRKAHLRTWCCFDKGYTQIKSQFVQNAYTTDEFPSAIVEVDNSESKLRIQNIQCVLWRSIRISDHHSTHFVKTRICSNSSEGVPVGESLLANQAVNIQLNLPAYKAEVEKTCSTKGRLIQCLFTIEAGANMDGSCMCCGDTPTVSCPMILHSGQSVKPMLPIAPSDWNPVQIPIVNIEYSQQYDYAPSAPVEEI